MLGEKLDYWLLRPFTHSRNIATEEELNERFISGSPIEVEDAKLRLEKLLHRLEGNFSISSDRHYLDVGCGTGDLAVAITKEGCRSVTGIDIIPRNIDRANLHAKEQKVEDNAKFICGDVHLWTPPHLYDVILSFDALEHISNPKTFLQRMANFIAPNGIFVLAFGPLFHSPLGDHMCGFFRIPIPWRGVLFSEKAILRLRTECFRPTNPADEFKKVDIGFNLMKYSEFLKYVHETGWKLRFLAANPQLKKVPPLYGLSKLLTSMPVVKNYIASDVYAVLSR